MPNSRPGRIESRISGHTEISRGLTRTSSGQIRISNGLIKIRKVSTSGNSDRTKINSGHIRSGRTSRTRNITPRSGRLPRTLDMEVVPLILARIIQARIILAQIVPETSIQALRLPGI